jgi:hypothetical protein
MTMKPQVEITAAIAKRILKDWKGADWLRAKRGLSNGLEVSSLLVRTERLVGGPNGSGGRGGPLGPLGLLRSRAEASKAWLAVASELNGVAMRAEVA